MDINKLRVHVFEKTGIRIDASDPIFALVALNEAVLSEYSERHLETLRLGADILRDQTAQLMVAGERYRSVLQELAILGQSESAPPPVIALERASAVGSNPTQKDIAPPKPSSMQWLVGALGVATLSAALTLGGGWIFRKDPPAPSAPVKIAQPVAPALTQEQIAMMENGEKFAKFWPKLDAPTQARIKRILQQP